MGLAIEWRKGCENDFEVKLGGDFRETTIFLTLLLFGARRMRPKTWRFRMRASAKHDVTTITAPSSWVKSTNND